MRCVVLCDTVKRFWVRYRLKHILSNKLFQKMLAANKRAYSALVLQRNWKRYVTMS